MSAASFDYDRFGDVAGPLKRNVHRLRLAWARGFKPPPRMSVAEWAERHREFPEESPYPGKWRHSTAPYLIEIMEGLTPSDPCEEIAVIKSGQSGATAAAENFVGFISDISPGPAMYVQATFRAAIDWAEEKLWPMVEATPRLNPVKGGTIRAQNERSGSGSTKYRIKFRRGGYLLLAGANSAATLRQHTIRFAIEDDLDQFPDDLDNQGSPEVMVDNRLKVYRRQGLSKRIKISTPTIKGASKIGAAYEASDKRRYYLKCPHCGERFDPAWSDIVWPDGNPEEATVVAPCCGGIVEHWQKQAMSLPDGWLPTVLEAEDEKPPRHMTEDEFLVWKAKKPHGRRRGYHVTGIISSFETWADLATLFLAAQGDQNKLKAWTNLHLGELFELKVNTPDYEKLRELREQDWGYNQVPYGPLAITMGCDVQGDGIFYEIVGWAENEESWSLAAGFLPGATDVKGEGAWADLEKVARKPVAFPAGRKYPIDQVCVDAGYNTEAAEAFCKAHPRRLAVFGRDGWARPILGRGENLRYETQGRNTGQASKRAEDKAYIVGTYGVKLAFYGFLRSTIKAAEEEMQTKTAVRVRGRCHFCRDASDDWFEQITSEGIAIKIKNGYPKRVWDVLPGRENHYLDCRVYNFAAAEKLKLGTLTEGDWAKLRLERMSAPDPRQADLLDMALRPVSTSKPNGAPPVHNRPYIEISEGYL